MHVKLAEEANPSCTDRRAWRSCSSPTYSEHEGCDIDADDPPLALATSSRSMNTVPCTSNVQKKRAQVAPIVELKEFAVHRHHLNMKAVVIDADAHPVL